MELRAQEEQKSDNSSNSENNHSESEHSWDTDSESEDEDMNYATTNLISQGNISVSDVELEFVTVNSLKRRE